MYLYYFQLQATKLQKLSVIIIVRTCDLNVASVLQCLSNEQYVLSPAFAVRFFCLENVHLHFNPSTFLHEEVLV
jgi:hypothetical protein